MKKLLSILGFGLISIGTYAQYANEIMVFGDASVSFSGKSNSDDLTKHLVKNKLLDTHVGAGYFMDGSWFVGGMAGFGWERKLDASDGDTLFHETKVRTRVFSLGPVVRYYYPIGEKVKVFAQSTLTYAHGVSHQFSEKQMTRIYSNVFAMAVSPGISFRPFENVGFDLSYQFGHLSFGWDQHATFKS